MSQSMCFYKPPILITELIKERAKYESRCIQGHSIGVCLACGWKGCTVCEDSIDHAKEEHFGEGFFLNLVNASITYFSNPKLYFLRCLYAHDISGKHWEPQEAGLDYMLDTGCYNYLIDLLF